MFQILPRDAGTFQQLDTREQVRELPRCRGNRYGTKNSQYMVVAHHPYLLPRPTRMLVYHHVLNFGGCLRFKHSLVKLSTKFNFKM